MAKCIGTHSGKFHCDDVFSCALIRFLPEYKEARIVRSRDSHVLSSCDIVVDVGGVFDPNKRLFDHHQKSFSHSMFTLSDGQWDNHTKLSSCGLIYYYYGKQIISSVLETSAALSETDLELVYKHLYSSFVEEIDAIDNGISICNDASASTNYRINTNISSRVSRLNPAWNMSADQDECFTRAVRLVSAEFLSMLNYIHGSWLPARGDVLRAIETRCSVHPSGSIIRLDHPATPWEDHLFSVETEANAHILFVIYQDESGWRVKTVPTVPHSFCSRLALLSSWRGLRGAQLQSVSGITDAVFVHANGFIGGAQTQESVIKMALFTIDSSTESS